MGTSQVWWMYAPDAAEPADIRAIEELERCRVDAG
jgi:hypothetical protein